jgi:hypothetical protein
MCGPGHAAWQMKGSVGLRRQRQTAGWGQLHPTCADRLLAWLLPGRLAGRSLLLHCTRTTCLLVRRAGHMGWEGGKHVHVHEACSHHV